MAKVRCLAAPATVASAATTDLGASDETILTVSGVTTITGFGTVSAGIYKLVTFSGALTLTHNATSLILLGGVNRTTVAGDCGLYVSLGGGNWKEYFYSPIGAYQPLNNTLTAISNGSLGPFAHRNKIINGNFDIWQKAISQTVSGYGSADRWSSNHGGTTKTFSRQAFALGQTDVPGEPAYFARTVVTSTAGPANHSILVQAIESVRTFAGKTATISFWAKADSAKNIAIEFTQYFGTGGTPSASVTGIGAQLIPLTTTWQKFTRTVAIPSIAGKTLGTNNNDYLAPHFWFDAGPDHAARSASLGQQSGTFDIACVQVEEGGVATPFEQRPIGYELSLCQRYFHTGRATARFYAAAAGHVVSTPVYFPAAMRTPPVLATSAGEGRANVSTVTIGGGNTHGGRFEITAAAAGDTYALMDIYTADAEL